MIRRCILLIGLLILSQGRASAQPAPESLFVELPRARATAALQAAPRSGRASVVARRAIGMRLDRLFTSRQSGDRIELNLADRTWIAALDRIDTDANGFRSWVGRIEGIDHSHVIFTERDGTVSGLVDGVETVFQVVTSAPGSFVLEQIDRSKLGGELDPLKAELDPPNLSATADSPAEHTGLTSDVTAAADDGSTIDVLILYTPSARAARGGTAAIDAAAAQIISDSNTAFQRSGITTRFRLAGTSQLALTEAAVMSNDLTTVTWDTTATALRNQFGADLVQLLVSSPDQSTCGVGWLYRGSTTFHAYAYSVADVACLSQYTATHELGHNLGSHHAAEDGASEALFPYSFGFKDPIRGFRTVMAYQCAAVNCPRILNFSNPSVTNNGFATGATLQNNALSINNATLAVANFRQRPQSVPPPPTAPLPPPPTTPPPVTPTATAPVAPTGLAATVQGFEVTLRWNPANDASGTSPATNYTLGVGTAPGLSNVFYGAIGNVTTASGSVPAGLYYWRVVASNAIGYSATSVEGQVQVGLTCTPPGAPQGFVHSVSGRAVTLGWAPGAGGAPTSYIIEAGSSAGVTDLFYGDTGGPITGISGIVGPGTYFARIRASNACGVSAPSLERVVVVY
jgi:hypothetical protein